MGFFTLSEILGRLRGQNEALGKRMDQSDVFRVWGEAVGEAVARHAKPVSVKKNILWVAVSHPIWNTELHHKRHAILEKLKSLYEKSQRSDQQPFPIEQIRFFDSWKSFQE